MEPPFKYMGASPLDAKKRPGSQCERPDSREAVGSPPKRADKQTPALTAGETAHDPDGEKYRARKAWAAEYMRDYRRGIRRTLPATEKAKP